MEFKYYINFDDAYIIKIYASSAWHYDSDLIFDSFDEAKNQLLDYWKTSVLTAKIHLNQVKSITEKTISEH